MLLGIVLLGVAVTEVSEVMVPSEEPSGSERVTEAAPSSTGSRETDEADETGDGYPGGSNAANTPNGTGSGDPDDKKKDKDKDDDDASASPDDDEEDAEDPEPSGSEHPEPTGGPDPTPTGSSEPEPTQSEPVDDDPPPAPTPSERTCFLFWCG